MKRIDVKRKKTIVTTIVEALSASLHKISLDEQEALPPTITDTDFSTTTTDSHHPGNRSPYHHSSPSTAIQPSLLELFSAPFCSYCFVAIDGDEAIYANKHFEKWFLGEEECNHRLQQENGSPRDIIAR